MYIPPHFNISDRRKLLAFVDQYGFATLITGKEAITATHLPFIVEEQESEMILYSHMARANPQWREFGEKEVLLIFQGPHSYISPVWYENNDVPTWNYTAVHVYGKPEILGSEEAERVLEKTVKKFDLSYYNDHYKKLSEKYFEQLKKGIVAFSIKAGRLEGKFKLSQNRSEKDRACVINQLEKQKDHNARALAEFMRSYENER